MKNRVNNSLFDKQLMKSSLADSFRKLDPRQMTESDHVHWVEVVTPVMLVMIGYIAVTGDESQGLPLYNIVIFIVLFATIIFANFAEKTRRRAARLRPIRCARPARKRLRNVSRRTVSRIS